MNDSDLESEYYDAMVTLLEWIWGEGFMAPGGEGNVDRMVAGLALEGRRVLDVGSGLGGPGCYLASRHGAIVTGIDLEAHLVNEANRRAQAKGLAERVRFLHVGHGPFEFDDDSFDAVVTSGALTQTPDKRLVLDEMFRVLKPGGTLSCYEWLKSPGEYSQDMLYFFEMEGLTYNMVTLEDFGETLERAGYSDVILEDASPWYRKEARREYELMSGPGYSKVVDLIGRKDADHLIEDWRSMVVVCEKGEMRQAYIRARKPARAVAS